MQTVTNGTDIVSFGGEPATHHHGNTENVVQIAAVVMKTGDREAVDPPAAH